MISPRPSSDRLHRARRVARPGWGTSGASDLRERLLARWVAENLLAEHRARADWLPRAWKRGAGRWGGLDHLAPGGRAAQSAFRRVDVFGCRWDESRSLARSRFVVQPPEFRPTRLPRARRERAAPIGLLRRAGLRRFSPRRQISPSRCGPSTEAEGQQVSRFFARFAEDVEPRAAPRSAGFLPHGAARLRRRGAALEFSRFAPAEGTASARQLRLPAERRREIELGCGRARHRANVPPARYQVPGWRGDWNCGISTRWVGGLVACRRVRRVAAARRAGAHRAHLGRGRSCACSRCNRGSAQKGPQSCSRWCRGPRAMAATAIVMTQSAWVRRSGLGRPRLGAARRPGQHGLDARREHDAWRAPSTIWRPWALRLPPMPVDNGKPRATWRTKGAPSS